MFRPLQVSLLGLGLLLVGCPTGVSPRDSGFEPDDTWPPGAGEAGVLVLGEDGPFIDHEARTARSGDLLLQNEYVRFVIEGIGPSDWYIPEGGGIVDADLVRPDGEGDYDGIDEWQPIVGLAPLEPERVEVVSDGSDGGPAHVRVSGREGVLGLISSVVGIAPEPQGFDIEVDYILEPGSHALKIVTTVYNETEGTLNAEIGDFAILGDDEAEPVTIPGGFDRALPQHPELLASTHEKIRWALGYFSAEGPLAFFGGSTVAEFLGGGDITLWITVAGKGRLRPSESLSVTRYLALGRSLGEVIEERDAREGRLTVPLSGKVTDGTNAVSGARVAVVQASDATQYVTGGLSDENGLFRLAAPPGDYQVIATAEGVNEWVELPEDPRLLAEGHTPSPPVDVTLVDREVGVTLELSPMGTLSVTLVDDNGDPIPGKVTAVDEGAGSADRKVLGERRPYASQGVRKVFWTADGTFEAPIRPGTYTFIGSRGYDWELDRATGIEVPPGGKAEVTLQLVQSVPHPEWVVMDGHLHASPSVHGEATMAERIVTNIAEGLDVHIASDHDRIVDYSPVVEALALRPRQLSIMSDEISSVRNGHHNPWPLTPDLSQPNEGAPPWWTGLNTDELYDHAIGLGAEVLQVNHGAGSTGFFGLSGYDPATGRVGRPEYYTEKFNTMEVHNGRGNGGHDALLNIWYSFLDFGKYVAITGVSDSHHRIPEAGHGRTYVKVGTDDIADVTIDDVVDGTLGLATVPTTGLFPELVADDGAEMGELASVTGGKVSVTLKVRGPTWTDLTRVQLVTNGGVVLQTWDETTDPAPALSVTADDTTWFETTVELTPGEDSWYVLRADGSVSLAPVYGGMTPWGVTSPLFVDADGDGKFTAPGR